jgi:hypothetical protein
LEIQKFEELGLELHARVYQFFKVPTTKIEGSFQLKKIKTKTKAFFEKLELNNTSHDMN